MSAQDSLVRLKQLNQPEASGFILAVVLPYLLTGFGNVNTGTLTGVFYPRNSNPSGYLRNSDITGYATLQFVSGNNDTVYNYVNAHFYPLSSNPSGYITSAQTGVFGQTGNFITTGQTGQFYPRSNPSGFITAAQAGGVQSVSVTGNNLSGVLTFSGIGGIRLINSGQIVYFSGGNSSFDSSQVVLTTGNQTVSGVKTFDTAIRTTGIGFSTGRNVIDVTNATLNRWLTASILITANGGSPVSKSIDWNNGTLYSLFNSNPVLSWQQLKCYDLNGNDSIAWNSHILSSGATPTLDWGRRLLSGDWSGAKGFFISGKSVTTGGPYYPLTGNPAGYLTSGGTFYPKTGNPSGYLEAPLDGFNIRQATGNIKFNGFFYVGNVLDTQNSILLDNSSIRSLDWNARNLRDVGASISLDWSQRNLFGTWQAYNFNLFDNTSSFKALNFDTNSSWYLQSLYPNGNAKIQFYDSTHTGTMPYISGFNLVNCVGITGTINPTQVVFVTGTQGISGNKTFGNQTTFNGGVATQVITGLRSGSPSIDVNSGFLYNSSKEICVDWPGHILYGRATNGTSFDFDQGIYIGIDGGTKTLEAINYLLYDGTETVSVNWTNRLLSDSAGLSAVSWENRNLYDSSANLSLDFDGRTLNDSAGHSVLDWDNSLLIDITGTHSIDWHNRILFNTSQVRSLDWQNRLMSGDWQVNGSFFGGGGATSGVSGSLAFGNGARARSKSTIALVQDADAFADWAVAIGFGASAGATSSFAFGEDATTAVGYGCMAFGAGASSIGTYSIAMGRGAVSQNDYSFVISMVDLPAINDNQPNQFLANFTGGFIFTGSPVQAEDFQISGRSVHHGDTIYDTSDMVSVLLADRQLIYNGNAAIDWAAGAARDPMGVLSIQWNDADRKLYDNSELISQDWNNRFLYDNSNIGSDLGTGLSVDYGSRKLYDTGHNVTIDWQRKILSGTWNAQGLLVNGGPITGSAANTGQLTGVFYPLRSNPSGYITTGQTGSFASTGSYTDISGAGGITIVTGTNILYVSGSFYPLSSNPSGFITTGQTGAFGGSANTGVLTGVFYPLTSNPSGYITSSQTGGFVSTSQTGRFVTTGQTGNFVTTSQTGQFYPNGQNPSGYITSSQTGSFSNSIMYLTGNQTIPSAKVITNNGDLTFNNNANFIVRDVIDGVNVLTIGVDNNFTINDLSNKTSAQFYTRNLYDNTAATSIDWNQRLLYDTGGANPPALNWATRTLSGNWNIQNATISGFSLGNTVVEGQKIFKSPKIDFRTTGSYSLFLVPSGFLFNVDAMEVITTDISSPSAAPFVRFGNTSDSSVYQTLNQTISNSQFSRHIYDNPQDTINSGTTLTATIGTASTASMHSGFLIYKGYLIRNT